MIHIEFIEWYPRGYGVGFKVTEKLFETTSQFQKLAIYETEGFGKLLVLDGTIQLVEHGEKSYHEVLVHPALLAHPNPEDILIIGGGDGGALREVLKHVSVKKATLVEIDEAVVTASMGFLNVDDGLLEKMQKNDEPRAELIIGDGIAHVATAYRRYDAVIIDSTDPVGPAKQLFDTATYKNIYRALKDDGICMTQAGSTYLFGDELADAYANMRAVFDAVAVFSFPVIGYASPWSFLVGMKGGVDIARVDAGRGAALGLEYYDAERHETLFQMPKYIRERLQK